MTYRFQIWVRINNTQTAQVYMHGSSDQEIRAVCEAQYGVGNVIAVHYASEND